MGKHNDTHLHPGTDKSAWIMRNVIEYLFDNAATGTSGSLATTLILTYGVYNLAPDSLVFGWAAAALLIALLRSLLLIYYRRASADTPLEKFLQPYRFLVLVSGVVVGLGCWLFVPIIPLEYQVMFIGAVLGINGGGIAVYAADHLTYKLFMFPSCLISIATFQPVGRVLEFGLVDRPIIVLVEYQRDGRLCGSLLLKAFIEQQQRGTS